MKNTFNFQTFALVVCVGLIFAVKAFAQTTQFTYQGRFTDSTVASPTNGLYDMEFKAFDALTNGNQLASTITIPNVRVINGVFTVSLDFGSQAFGGSDVFLEISVRPALNTNPLTVLNPRQMFTSAPYSIQSLNAFNAANADNSTNLGGIPSNQFVQTNDARLSDARNPLAGSANYIQNSTAVQPISNFNISGNGNVGGTLSGSIVNAATQFNINNLRVFITDSNDNLFAGKTSGAANTSGGSNSFFGTNAGAANTIGNSNSFFGRSAGLLNTSGDQNTFFGFNAGQSNTTGSSNTMFGFNAGNGSPVGMFNSTGIGFGAIPQGNQVTVIGYQAGSSTGIINSTAIGANAFVSTSNTVVIGTAATTTENPGILKVLTLGAAGSTSLCRNSQNQISTCTAGNFTEANNKILEMLQQQNLQLTEQLKEQKTEIEALKLLVCAANPTANICEK